MPYTVLGDLQTLTLNNETQMENECCILTLNNDVILMGNAELEGYTAGNPFATLPESMRPEAVIKVPVYLGETLVCMTVSTSGELLIDTDVQTLTTLYINGVTFNVCDQYYNSTIGNNYSQGTSPLN